ncbi:MAG TPA: phage holin family protein [Burkholderiales bacterium]|nr:phage holin family protein [Burkholderiales bacterium]
MRAVAFAPMALVNPIWRFLLFWGVNALSLWVADEIFSGIAFESKSSLFVSALLLGMVNTFVKPILLVLTLPITVVTLGLFLLILNASMLMLVARMVPGFHLEGFWSGALVALFVSVFSYAVNRALGVDLVVIRRIR